VAKITQATNKLLALKKRIRAICGGTSASKTYSILMILIDYAQIHKNKKIDVMSESYPHLEDGAIKDFKGIMLDREYWKSALWNETKHIYTFETGSTLKFISVDTPGKAHGPRRDVLFINEANNIPFDIYEQLEVRTKEIIWLDWNPSNEFWYYTEVKEKVDHDFIVLTYLDCLNALDQRIIDSIESRKNRKDWWRVYGEGQLGEVRGKIYRDWQLINEIPHEARLERYGLDFGYSNDPTVIVAIYYYNGGYIFDEITYQRGLLNKQIADIILDQENSITVKADSAEPKSIDEITEYGVNIQPAQKGPGSVGQGIDFVQSKRCSITQRSIHIIKEYRNYLWQTDKDGNIINEPEHQFSHSMDAIRYGMENVGSDGQVSDILQDRFEINKANLVEESCQ